MFHYFLRILNEEDLLTHPNRGASFEGYVIEQIIQFKSLFTPEYEEFFFRSSDQIEVDLILKKGLSHIAVEIKSSLAPTKESCRSLFKYVDTDQPEKAYVIGLGKDRYPLSNKIEVIGIHWWIKNKFPCFGLKNDQMAIF